MRALTGLRTDPLKIFGNTEGACIFLCLSVENCPDGKITVSWKLVFSVMSQMNTNLHSIQRNLSWKVPTHCLCHGNCFQWFHSMAYLDFKTHPLVNMDCIVLLFVHTNISSHFLSEINVTAFSTPLIILFSQQASKDTEIPVEEISLKVLPEKIHCRKVGPFYKSFLWVKLWHLKATAVLSIPTFGNAVQPSEARDVQF